jgi:hypothetical protein
MRLLRADNPGYADRLERSFEDDITIVQQFKHLRTVIPELIHIKMLEMRGAYTSRGPTPLRHDSQVSAADETAAPVEGARDR